MCDCQKNGSQFNSFYNEYTDGTYANADGRGTSFLEGLVDGFLGTDEQQLAPNPNPTGMDMGMGMQTPPTPPTESFWKRNGLMIGGVVVLGAVITGILIFKSRNK
jgi:hypothetical protein